MTVGTATNVAEAVALAESGVDVICAQGAEAGGHHGSWLADAEDSLFGTLALVATIRAVAESLAAIAAELHRAASLSSTAQGKVMGASRPLPPTPQPQ